LSRGARLLAWDLKGIEVRATREGGRPSKAPPRRPERATLLEATACPGLPAGRRGAADQEKS